MGGLSPIEFQIYEVLYLPSEDWETGKSDFFADEPKRGYFHSLEAALLLARKHWLVPTYLIPDINSHGEPPTIYRNVYKGNIGLDQVISSNSTQITAELILIAQYEIRYSHPGFPGSQNYGDSVQESRNLLA